MRSGSPSELLEGLEKLNFELVLMNHEPANDSLINYKMHHLAEQPVSIVGTPARLDPTRPIKELLMTQPFILPTTTIGVRTAFDAMVSRMSVRSQVAAEVDGMAMLRLLAREGIGLALVAPIVAQDELSLGRLVEAQEHPRIKENFRAVTFRRRALTSQPEQKALSKWPDP